MTDEQIKQNAEEYADVHGRHMADYYGVKDAFIAGAHSLDEEIKELNGQVTLHKDRADYYHDLYMKLRNPWISVDDRLPEKTRNLSPFPDEYDTKVCIVINLQGGKRLAYRDCKGAWRDDYTCAIVNQNNLKITNWMPIPKLKGE